MKSIQKYSQRIIFCLCLLGISYASSKTTQIVPLECQLSNLHIEKSDCSAEKTFYVTLNFTHDGNSECFIVTGNGIRYGEFKYSQLPLKIGPLKGNCTTEYEFAVRDCANEKCSVTGILGKVCCETKPDCVLSDLNLVKSDCDAKGLFYVTINLHYKNVGDCFSVQGNGVNYGKFKYSQLPLKIGPLKANCETNYEFQITDCNNEKC
ncbi:MAG: hypothetical protein ABIO44_09000, partial [Saprospiraceae bacterium]